VRGRPVERGCARFRSDRDGGEGAAGLRADRDVGGRRDPAVQPV